MAYVYSTLAAPYDFAIYGMGADGIAKPVKYIHIKGGGQIAIPSGFGFDTPLAIMTKVSDEDLALLKEDWTFRHFLEKGHIRIEETKKNADKVAGSMELPTTAEGAPVSETEIAGYSSEDMDVGVIDGKAKKRK